MLKIGATVERMVQEELTRMLTEAAEKAPKLSEDLEILRKKLMPEMSTEENMNSVASHGIAERRIQITTVADLLGVKVNELMLHFLNNVKASNTRHLVEYHLGQVIFYSHRK